MAKKQATDAPPIADGASKKKPYLAKDQARAEGVLVAIRDNNTGTQAAIASVFGSDTKVPKTIMDRMDHTLGTISRLSRVLQEMAKEAAEINAADPDTEPKLSDKAKDWLRADLLRKTLETIAKEVKEHASELEEALLKAFEVEGVDSIAVLGRKIHTRRDLWPKLPEAGEDGLVEIKVPEDILPDELYGAEADSEGLVSVKLAPKEAVILLLKADPETAEFVQENYNTNTLKAYIAKLEEDPETMMPKLPPLLDGVLTVSEKFSIGSTKA